MTDIHIFTSRNKVFDKEQVLQETMILKIRKTAQLPLSVNITSSLDCDSFDKKTAFEVPYDIIVSGKDRYVYIVTSNDEINVLQTVNSLGFSLPSIGLKMKTGLTTDYRNRDLLRNESEENIVPLFYPHHLKSGRVIFPIGKKFEYLSDNSPGMLQLNRNYLFVKRFTSTEERRRLQCAVYLARQFPAYKMISTQNKINFIDTIDNSEINENLLFGLYITFNSSLYDKYYRILNGSTQVNSTEINSIPIPPRKTLEFMGLEIQNSNDYSTDICDKILKGAINV